MTINTERKMAAAQVVAALQSKVLVDLCKLDDAPRSELLKRARFAAHEAISPNFTHCDSLRIVLAERATIMSLNLMSKAELEKAVRRIRFATLDSVEDVIGAGKPSYFNRPGALNLRDSWINVPRGLEGQVSQLADQVFRFRNVISVLRYEAGQMSDNPETNAILKSFMDKVMPLLTDYTNDALTHDRDYIVERLAAKESAFISVKSEGWGTWSATSMAALDALRKNWEAVFEVTARGVRDIRMQRAIAA